GPSPLLQLQDVCATQARGHGDGALHMGERGERLLAGAGLRAVSGRDLDVGERAAGEGEGADGEQCAGCHSETAATGGERREHGHGDPGWMTGRWTAP